MIPTSTMASRSRSPVAAQRGFALAAVLWLLAGLAVLVTSVSVSMLTVARTNRDLDARLRVELAAQHALASVAFLFLTQQTLGVGIKVGDTMLPLDGRSPLRMGVDFQVDLQDQLGLISINGAVGDDLRRLLVRCGATAAQGGALVDALLDYIDEDSLKRLNGAEAFDYASRGLPSPRNQLLASRAELWQVMGWPAIRDSWTTMGCAESVSVADSAAVNLWTAPLPVLLAVGMSPEDAAAALVERDRMRGVPQLSPLLMAFRDRQGSSIQAMSRFAVRSRGDLRVTVSSTSASMARRFVLSRVGASHLAPYLVAEEEWIPAEAATPSPTSGPDASVPARTLSIYLAQAVERNPLTNVQASPLPAERP